MARGGPTSERSRHISIQYFWICERMELGEVTLVHRATNLMYANVLTKPLQGKQFMTERDGITNCPAWKKWSLRNLLQECVGTIDIPLLLEEMIT